MLSLGIPARTTYLELHLTRRGYCTGGADALHDLDTVAHDGLCPQLRYVALTGIAPTIKSHKNCCSLAAHQRAGSCVRSTCGGSRVLLRDRSNEGAGHNRGFNETCLVSTALDLSRLRLYERRRQEGRIDTINNAVDGLNKEGAVQGSGPGWEAKRLA